MATDIATLGLKLDGDGLVTGTDKAAVAVKRLGQEGDRTEQQVGKLDLTLKRAAGSTQAFEAAQKRATAVGGQAAQSRAKRARGASQEPTWAGRRCANRTSAAVAC